MNRRMLLISNCGTSLLSNDASEVDRNWLMEHANEPDVDGGRLGSIMEASRRKLLEADAAKQRLMSAEIKRIYAAIERYRPEEVFHQLVHSDTAQGKAGAALVREVLDTNTSFRSAAGLRTDDLNSFRGALSELIKDLVELVQEYRERLICCFQPHCGLQGSHWLSTIPRDELG